MKKLLSVMAFSLLTIGFFTWFSNFGIPQIEPAPPPKEEKIDLGSMTMEKFVALGEKIFKGKGTCTLCHNPVGGRAPLLDRLGDIVPKRLADKAYKGEAKDAEAYLLESLLKPSAYVVPGFGKKGTNDAVSPMPDVSAGSVGLNEAEMSAVIAYLQKSGGMKVTVKIPSGAKPPPPDEKEPEGEGRTPLKTVKAIVKQFNCGACHKVAGEKGEAGPDLTHIGKLRDRAFLRRSILNPNADISKGFEKDMMPADYGEQLFAKELELVVEFLVGSK